MEVLGIFRDIESAGRGVEGLVRAGFTEAQITSLTSVPYPGGVLVKTDRCTWFRWLALAGGFLEENQHRLGTRNLPPTISDATAVNILGYIRIGSSDFYDLGGMRVAEAATVGRMVEAAAGSTSIYLGSLVQGAGTYTASGVKVRLNFIPE